MASSGGDHHGFPSDEYGLGTVAQHNAMTNIDHRPRPGDVRGQQYYVSVQMPRQPMVSLMNQGQISHGHFQESLGSSDGYNPTTPQSSATSDGVRTRSGRSAGRNDSPFGSSQPRVSKSPASRPKRERKSKTDKSKTPKLTAPLSILTKDMTTPLKDIDAWVNRSPQERRHEAEMRKGYVTRPMNSFMLYRSCYAERTKQWCTQNNHQVVSSVSGESWPMEPEEVRKRFEEWAKVERANHQAAHPEYKFSPSKTPAKRRRGNESDNDYDASDLDGDPDGEYRGPRSSRPRRQHPRSDPEYISSTVGFGSHPYFGGQQGVGYQQYQFSQPRPLPSNAHFDVSSMPYSSQAGAAFAADMYAQPRYSSFGAARAGSPVPQTLGGYGLPGTQATADELFGSSRGSTPMQQFAAYTDPGYVQYHTGVAYGPTPAGYAPGAMSSMQQMYEHAPWPMAAGQPQGAIDPTLHMGAMADPLAGAHGSSHFVDAMRDMVQETVLHVPDYLQESTSPNQMLGLRYSPTQELS